MKRSELLCSLMLVPLDIIMILLGFMCAYFYRANSDVIFIWRMSDYFKFSLVFSLIWVAIFAIQGLYTIRSNIKTLDEFAKIAISSSAGIMLVVGWLFISRTQFFSRLVILYSWLAIILLVFVGRFIVRLIQSYLRKYKIGVHRVLIIGSDVSIEHLVGTINSRVELGYEITGFTSQHNISNIKNLLTEKPFDEIILCDSDVSEEFVDDLIYFTQENHLSFKFIPNLYRLHSTNLEVLELAGIPFVEYKGTKLDGWGLVFKRAMDSILSICLLIVLSPIILIISILVKIDSKGPVIFQNERVGKKGNFMTYKFRTMYLEYCTGDRYGGSRAEKVLDKLIEDKNIKKGSAVYKISDDPRVTRVGSFLRKTSLDELPQIYNVLVGNMSLVGPRPHQPREVKGYSRLQRKLLIVKPGITGLAQISGRSDLTFDDEAKLDIFYLENWNIWFDIKILLRTIIVVLLGKGAY